MDKIPDAPYIREAERFGYPPFEDDPYPARYGLDKASGEMKEALSRMAEVIVLLEGTPFESEVCRIQEQMEDIDSMIHQLREEVLHG